MVLLLTHWEKLLHHTTLFSSDVIDSIKGDLGTIYFFLSRYKEAKILLHESIKTLDQHRKKPYKLGQLLSFLSGVYLRFGNQEKVNSS